MTRRRSTLGILLALALLTAPPAAAQKAAGIGTNPPGSVFYAIGSALAKVAGDAGTVRLNVQPYSGTARSCRCWSPASWSSA
jgi:TRAP-type uncharacterized transport system substrate-binding protein